MKRIFFLAVVSFTIISCNKENKIVSDYKEVAKAVDLKNMSDVEKLEYFSNIEFKSFDLYNFIIKKVNDNTVSEDYKSDFAKDKITFNVKSKFIDKTKFFGITDNSIEISDVKKDGFYSTNDGSIFISGYFKEGRFYFEKLNKLGF